MVHLLPCKPLQLQVWGDPIQSLVKDLILKVEKTLPINLLVHQQKSVVKEMLVIFKCPHLASMTSHLSQLHAWWLALMRDTFGTCPLLPVLRQLRLPPDTCFLRPLTGSPLHQATPVADHLGSTLSPTSTILLIPTLTHTPIHTHHHSTWSFIRLQPTV